MIVSDQQASDKPGPYTGAYQAGDEPSIFIQVSPCLCFSSKIYKTYHEAWKYSFEYHIPSIFISPDYSSLFPILMTSRNSYRRTVKIKFNAVAIVIIIRASDESSNEDSDSKKPNKVLLRRATAIRIIQ